MVKMLEKYNYLYFSATGASFYTEEIQMVAVTVSSLFAFQHTPCTVQSDNTMLGTCYSQDDCTDAGGIADGNCAAGITA